MKKRYFPFLRGKLNELIALRELSEAIAAHTQIVPIIEPVKNNSTTRISLDRFVQVSMPFLFICNPVYGDFRRNSQRLFDEVIDAVLQEYDNWTPALQVHSNTTSNTVQGFLDRYDERELAIIYQGFPTSRQTVDLLSSEDIMHHVFIGNSVGTAYINGIPRERRVILVDRFNRQARNADYPEREFFTDMNTPDGRPAGTDFGDFSIVGDQYSEVGGPAYAVAVHHIHYQRGDPGPLDISHFISDRTESTVDPAGKTIEAVSNLVNALDGLHPNDTAACAEYREIAESGVWHGLGYLKKLAIKHHLEVMLGGGILS
jgi:hypothetical protein